MTERRRSRSTTSTRRAPTGNGGDGSRAATPADPWGGAPPAWTDLADALLTRAAAAAGHPADRAAGLRILDEHAAAVVTALSPAPVAPAGDGDPDGLVEVAWERLRLVLDGDGRFARLAAAAWLDDLDAAVLSLLCAVELDTRRQRLVAYLNDDVTRTRPTLDLLRRVLGDAGVAAVGEDGRLRRAALVRVDTDGAWAGRQVAVADAVPWALVGDSSLDPALPPAAELYETVPGEGSLTPPAVAVVAGPDRTRRLQACLEALPADAALVVPEPEDAAGWEAVCCFATVHEIAVVVEVDEELSAAGRRWIDRAEHLSWAVSSRREVPVASLPARPWRELRPDPPLATTEEVDAVTGGGLGPGHRLTADQLRQLDRLVPVVGGDLTAAVRRLGAGPLEHLARRVRPRLVREDLVLLPDQDAALDELIARYRDRDVVHGEWGVPAIPSAGLVALFSGPSGTGKTTAAEVIAASLGLDLFVVDVSAVVSKYLGETEKNLERIFDAAAAGNHVLLFDEADALFGKRTEVSDARDRYANVEVAYLLQRLETFDGLLVLTTNLQRNIDPAFLRRVHVAVDFPLPAPAERARIWRRWLATGAPLGDVDVDLLAERHELAGGNIRNVCLTAAFLAAAEGTEVTTPLVVRALKREYQKLGRLVTDADFGV